MKCISKFIKQHEEELKKNLSDRDFLQYHMTQIGFLQHERLVHLIVTLSVILFFLIFLALFLYYKDILFFILFIILLVLATFYIFHYFKLENTVIKWYF